MCCLCQSHDRYWTGQPNRKGQTVPIPLTMDELIDDLLARIDRKEFPPGSQLPSGQQLADHYGVSPATIQRATARLRQRGVLVGRPGRGVFVADKQVR